MSHFSLRNITEQVDEIDPVSSTRALILGRLGANYPVANVVALPAGNVVEHFLCYWPALSPDHRLLAFVKPFPGHPGPVSVNYEYVVYDLTLSPAYNRPHLKPGVAYDAGWPVYPPGATNAAGENILPPGSSYHGWSSQRLFWFGNETLALTDYFEDQDKLVVVDLSRGIKDPHIRTSDLDPSQIIDLDRCGKNSDPEDFARWARNPAGLIRVDQISPEPGRPGRVCLHFVPGACVARAYLAVPLP